MNLRHAKESKKLETDKLGKTDPVPHNRAGIGGPLGSLSSRRLGQSGKFDRLDGDAPGVCHNYVQYSKGSNKVKTYEIMKYK